MYCEKCKYEYNDGICRPECPHEAYGVQSFDVDPEGFGGTDEGSHYMSQQAFSVDYFKREMPIDNLRRVQAEGILRLENAATGRCRWLLAALTEMISRAADAHWRFDQPMIEEGVTADGVEQVRQGSKIYITIELEVLERPAHLPNCSEDAPVKKP